MHRSIMLSIQVIALVVLNNMVIKPNLHDVNASLRTKSRLRFFLKINFDCIFMNGNEIFICFDPLAQLSLHKK